MNSIKGSLEHVSPTPDNKRRHCFVLFCLSVFFLIPLLLRFLDVCLHFNETEERKSVDLDVWGSEKDLGEAGGGEVQSEYTVQKIYFQVLKKAKEKHLKKKKR